MTQQPRPSRGVIFSSSARIPHDCPPMDSNMRKVLRQVDGHRSLASVAFAAGLTMSEMQDAVRALVAMNLIAPVSPENRE